MVARPPLPPIKKKYSVVKVKMTDNGTLRSYFREFHQALHSKAFRFQICVPSTCSLQDIRHVIGKLTFDSYFNISIPKCYMKKKIPLQAENWAFFVALLLLCILSIIGTVLSYQNVSQDSGKQSLSRRVLSAFSLSTNFRHLISASGGSSDLRCIHGIRALGMCYIVLGHTYVLLDTNLVKDPSEVLVWFNAVEFQLIHSAWLSVETFFFLSGLLIAFGGLRALQKTKGSINIPLMIFRRFLKLTPPLLLMMGIVMALPLLSYGPFWYEYVDPQVDSCKNYWWTSLLYISNWFGIDKGCVMTSWYLSADFQLHIFSLILLIVMYRYPKVGLASLFVLIGLSCVAIAAQTVYYDTIPAGLISVGDPEQVLRLLNKVHAYTLTHVGPHCIGMIVGSFILKNSLKKMSKLHLLLGWCLSTSLALGAIFSGYPFTIGQEVSESVSLLYASVYRSAFITGVAWVAHVCIKGQGGIVNSLLSASILVPLSRLTFMVYLVHPLVIWVRLGAMRGLHNATHFDYVYSFMGHLCTSFAIAVPFYLLLEAPLSNLERMFFSRAPKETVEKSQPKDNL